MKKLTIFAAVAMMALAVVSCGSSKPAAAAAPAAAPSGMQAMTEGTAVIQFAEAMPDKRAWGDGSHFKEATATRLAEANARAKLASAIQAKVIQGIETYATSAELSSAEALLRDQSATVEDVMTVISKEVVTNTVSVKSERYRSPDNQIVVYSCIEYRASVQEMVKQMADKFEQQIPDAVKEDLAFKKFMFQNSIGKQFEDYTATAE